MNTHQISRIDISPEVVDCIVFWTKNPESMMNKLDRLNDYKFYFQFTLTGYGKDIEPCLPNKREVIIPVFQRLSSLIGKEKVIWRYDPIIITNKYTQDYHIKAFHEIATELNGYCDRVVISFVDFYAKIKENLKIMNALEIENQEVQKFASRLTKIAKDNNMQIAACAEKIDLSSCGIQQSNCIDRTLIEQIVGYPIKAEKDKNQRRECGCIESIDIGAYDSCLNGCKYCYANHNGITVKEKVALYDKNSPLLCGKVGKKDNIYVRKAASLIEGQISMFNYNKIEMR